MKTKCFYCGLPEPKIDSCTQVIPPKYVETFGTNFRKFYADTCHKCPEIGCPKNKRKDLEVCPSCHYPIGTKK